MITRLLFALFLAATALAQTVPLPAASTFAIWPEGKVPGRTTKDAETTVTRSDRFHRVTQINRPTLTLFSAPRKSGAAPAPAVLICPGGGYGYVVVDKEGSEIAAWLNTNGVNALVLKYRVPNNRDGALQDLQRTISLVRERAAEWHIDPKRVGVMGFSAGGHLAARASTRFDERAYTGIDAIDRQSCRPDFTVLVYPAYLDDKQGKVSPDLNLSAKIPPTLIIHNEDDKSFITGSKVYHAALEAAKVAHEFKLYPTGGHGYGLHCEKDARAWPEDTLDWLRKNGLR